MAGSSESYHEPYELLSEETRVMHRALVSLMEELEAVDWYQQRADVSSDEELRSILVHNKHEEMEHAAMTLEWIRRRSPEFDKQLRAYLFTEGPIVGIEKGHGGGGGEGGEASLGIGALRPQAGKAGGV